MPHDWTMVVSDNFARHMSLKFIRGITDVVACSRKVLTHCVHMTSYAVVEIGQSSNLTVIDLVPPSHCPNQYWDIVNWTPRNELQWNFNRNSYIFVQENAFKMSSGEWRPFCFGLNVLKPLRKTTRVALYLSCFSTYRLVTLIHISYTYLIVFVACGI